MTTNAPTRRPISKVRIGTPALVGVVVALSIPVGAGVAFLNFPRNFHQYSSVTPITGAIKSVVVDGGAANLDIDGSGPAGGASVGQDVEWTGDKTKPPQLIESIDSQGVLHLSARCASSQGTYNGGDCSISWIAHVPAGVPLTATFTDGNVIVRNFTAPYNVRTTNGNIDVVNGDRGNATLRADNGEVNAAFTGQPKTIAATTTNGNVAITTNGSAYLDLVSAHNGNQHISNNGSTDRNSPGTITVTTVNGDVTIQNPSS